MKNRIGIISLIVGLVLASSHLFAATLTLSSGSCTGTALNGTQYVAFGGCSLAASGGSAPYTYSWSTNTAYASLPPGLILSASTGSVTGTNYGEGEYGVEFVVTDASDNTASALVMFELAGDNTTGGCTLFPADSAFHIKVTNLPVDTSPAAPIPSAYAGDKIHPSFGDASYLNQPNGIPWLRVPSTQALVGITTDQYQTYFTQGPWPWYAPIEGTQNDSEASTDPNAYLGDGHSLIVQTAGASGTCSLWEMFTSQFTGKTPYTSGPWADDSNAYWSNISSTGNEAYAMLPQDNGSTDAAGLPIAPLLVNASEVIGTGTPTAPNGSVQHPIRFTINYTLQQHVWPATAQAGTGSCTGGYEDSNGLILQPGSAGGSAPSSCSWSGPNGEIYRLKASVATPSCATSSPQSAIIIQGFRDYGIILADNGGTGFIVGTPDVRWNDNDLACLFSLTISDFEPVNVSSVIKTLDGSNLPTVSYQTTTSTPSTITSVAATCSPSSITTAQTSTCTATVAGTGSYSPAVTWTATNGAFSSNVFTPSAVGSVSIKATSAQDTTKSGSTTVTVTAVAPPPTQTATPIFSPAVGTYTSAQTITISDATTGATVYYTTNGTTPTTSSTKYTGAITVSSTTTLEAIATAPSHSNSIVASATYVISVSQTQTGTPTFSPTAGTYTSAQTVTISDTTAGTTIYYTTNGSTPTTGSTKYRKSVTVSSTETLKAIATASGHTTSAVGSVTYTIRKRRSGR